MGDAVRRMVMDSNRRLTSPLVLRRVTQHTRSLLTSNSRKVVSSSIMMRSSEDRRGCTTSAYQSGWHQKLSSGKPMNFSSFVNQECSRNPSPPKQGRKFQLGQRRRVRCCNRRVIDGTDECSQHKPLGSRILPTRRHGRHYVGRNTRILGHRLGIRCGEVHSARGH